MNAIDLVRAGKLSEARGQLISEVKSSPADAGKRTLLFQVLSFCGEWGKAEQHLDAIAARDSSRETGVQVYKNLLRAEKERQEVARLDRRPAFLPETPAYVEKYFSAWGKVREKKFEEAEDLLRPLEGLVSSTAGTADGESFAGFLDTDSFLSPFLEAIVHERYLWVPFTSIRELSISPPKTLFDLLWVPARVTTWEGLGVGCYLPVLYPDSSRHEDERVKLGRMTDWVSAGGNFFRGLGQHVYRVGDREKPLLEMREVLFRFAGPGERA